MQGRSRPLLRAVSPEDVPEPRPAPSRGRDRYADLDDRRLAAILAAEDTAVEHGLSPHTRSTCYVHRCWVHQCVGDPLHVIVVTGHRWCRRCELPVQVAVDETPPGAVHLFCPRCGQASSAANREVRQACRTSLAAMHGGDAPTLYRLPDA
ncbi:MAG TPA: hypothetical protein VGL47_39850 [Amycolatopsis sp.]|uniref:hypothetical protein n=1 Tax=Amycolatopsis sp. TaxID=37632 RepID=UPI002F401ECB